MRNRAARYGSILSVLFMLLLAACGGGASNSSSSSSAGPADALKALFTAVFKGEDVSSMICSTDAAVAASMKAGMDALKTAFTTGGAEVDAGGLTFTVKSESGDKAEVEVAGKLKITVAGASTEQDYPASAVPMTKESGVWKACG